MDDVGILARSDCVQLSRLADATGIVSSLKLFSVGSTAVKCQLKSRINNCFFLAGAEI